MTELEIKNFFSIIDTKIKLIEEVRKYYGKEVSPDFNSFDFWWVDENKVSEIIAFFLNPLAKHEQGDIFLKHFLKKFNLDFFKIKEEDLVQVTCEVLTDSGRRIDIVINKNNFEQVIGIENKIHIGTADQENQISDYLKYLRKKSKVNYCLIYLSPKEKALSNHSIDQDEQLIFKQENKLKLLNYEEHIIECIKEFSLLSENIRVKSFLKDFEKKLITMYLGEDNLNKKQVVVDYVSDNIKNLEISFLVANSLQDVKQQLRHKFEQQINEIGQELDFEVNGLALKPKSWSNHSIKFSYEGGGILYGLVRDKEDKNKARLLEVEHMLDEQLREKFSVSPWWPLWQFFYRNIESNEDFWKDIYSGKAKERARTFIKLVKDHFEHTAY
jgi:hypothetical protein